MNAELSFPNGPLVLALSSGMTTPAQFSSGEVFHEAGALMGRISQVVIGSEDIYQAFEDCDPAVTREVISEQMALSISHEHPNLNECLSLFRVLKSAHDERLLGRDLLRLISMDLLTIKQKGLPEDLSPVSLVDNGQLRDIETLIDLPCFDFQDALRRLLDQDDKAYWLDQLVNYGNITLNHKIKAEVASLLCRTWGDDATLLRKHLGLEGPMGLWEASARFTDAFVLACSPVFHAESAVDNEPWRRVSTTHIEKQLQALEHCHDYFRSVGVYDWQKLFTRLFSTVTGKNQFKPMPSAKQLSDFECIVRIGLERIPNAKPIMSMCLDQHLSAGNTLCPMPWEQSFARQVLDRIIDKARRDNKAVHHRPVEPASKCAETKYLCALLSLCAEAELIECSPEDWQKILVSRITGNLTLVDRLSDEGRVMLLNLDLGL